MNTTIASVIIAFLICATIIIWKILDLIKQWLNSFAERALIRQESLNKIDEFDKIESKRKTTELIQKRIDTLYKTIDALKELCKSVKEDNLASIMDRFTLIADKLVPQVENKSTDKSTSQNK